MERVGLFGFSGTGNTTVISNEIVQAFIKAGYQATYFSIDITMSPEELDWHAFDLIGIGYPVYGMGMPKLMNRFIKKIPKSSGQKVFLYMTAGDFSTVNHSAGHIAKKVLRKKGYDVVYERLFAMPSNFFIRYSDGLSVQLYKANLTKIKDMVHGLRNGVRRYLEPNFFNRSLFILINWIENVFGARGFGLSLRAKSTCTGCGICVKQCPMGNIYFKNEQIKIGGDCTFCMKCTYNCPVNAIDSSLFGFTILKEAYDGKHVVRQYLDNPDISLNELPEDVLGPDKKGYKKRFLYFENYIKNPKL